MDSLQVQQISQDKNADCSFLSSLRNGKSKRIIFEVKDTREGIEQEKLERLISDYSESICPTGSPKEKCFGLGLILSQIFKLNDCNPEAKIQVSSRRGLGSTFSFPLIMKRRLSYDFSEKLIDCVCSKKPFCFQSTARTNAEENIQLSNDFLLISESVKTNVRILIVDEDQVNLLESKKLSKIDKR